MRSAVFAGLILAVSILFVDVGLAEEQDWVVIGTDSRITLRVATPLGNRAGRFERWTGDIRFDPAAPERARVGIEVDADSLQMNDTALTRTAIGRHFLDSGRHPGIVFRLAGLEPAGASRFTARAEITLRGITRPVVFPVTLRSDGDTAQMAGGFTLDRAAFGIGTGGPWNGLIGRQVRVDVVLATRPAS